MTRSLFRKMRRPILRTLAYTLIAQSIAIPMAIATERMPEKKTAHVTINVAPHLLHGINLASVIKGIIDQAHERGIIEELPQGIINCHEALQKGSSQLVRTDIEQALPLITHALLGINLEDFDEYLSNILQQTDVTNKALRPGTESGNPIVGAAQCDLSEALSAIAKLKKIVIQDFNETWTILENLDVTITCSNIQLPCSAIALFQSDVDGSGILVIDLPGTYCLAEDITGSIHINSDNVVLHLNNKQVSNGITDNIRIVNRKNISIEHGTLTDSPLSGIALIGCNNIIMKEINLINNNTSGGFNAGIFASTSTAITIESSYFNQNRLSGIVLDTCEDSSIRNSICLSPSANGISIVNQSKKCMAQNNTCSSTAGSGIYLSNSSLIQAINNTCNTSATGILLEQTTNSNILHNTTSQCAVGIRSIVNSDSNIINNNICSHNGAEGIVADATTNTTFAHNTCNSNHIGISLQITSSCAVINNICDYNADHGIAVTSTENSLLFKNSCNNNLQTGIVLRSGTNNNEIIENIAHANIIGIDNFPGNISNKFFNNNSFQNSTQNYSPDIPVEVQGIAPTNCRYICNTDFPVMINLPGKYCLIEDGPDDLTGFITINTNNVILDLDNHTLKNSDTLIQASNVSHLVIENGILKESISTGIHINQCSDVTIQNITALNNNTSGNLNTGAILIQTGTAITVQSNYCKENQQQGIILDSCNNSFIKNNTMINNENNIVLQNNSTCTSIDENSCTESRSGIKISDSENISVAHNTCQNNLIDGIDFLNSHTCTIIENICNSNSNGITIEDSENICVIHNTCQNNLIYGIEFVNSHTCTIIENICNSNSIGINLGNVGNACNFISKNICNKNEFGIRNNFTSSTNSFFQNKTQQNSTLNYQNIPSDIITVFNTTTGTFPNPSTGFEAFTNLDIVS